MTTSQRVADGLVGVTWGSWLFANIHQINEVVQLVALLFAIATSIVAMRFHLRK